MAADLILMIYEGQNSPRESESKNFLFIPYTFPNLRMLGHFFFLQEH